MFSSTQTEPNVTRIRESGNAHLHGAQEEENEHLRLRFSSPAAEIGGVDAEHFLAVHHTKAEPPGLAMNPLLSPRRKQEEELQRQIEEATHMKPATPSGDKL